jgi:hypothetical protein
MQLRTPMLIPAPALLLLLQLLLLPVLLDVLLLCHSIFKMLSSSIETSQQQWHRFSNDGRYTHSIHQGISFSICASPAAEGQQCATTSRKRRRLQLLSLFALLLAGLKLTKDTALAPPTTK